MNQIETNQVVATETPAAKTVKKKAAKTKTVLNRENTKVLTAIVKNPDITATGIRKKLRLGFTPTRALSALRSAKFVCVSKDKGYTVSAKGTAALSAAPKIGKKRTVKKTAPVVANEPADVVVGLGQTQPAEAELAAV